MPAVVLGVVLFQQVHASRYQPLHALADSHRPCAALLAAMNRRDVGAVRQLYGARLAEETDPKATGEFIQSILSQAGPLHDYQFLGKAGLKTYRYKVGAARSVWLLAIDFDGSDKIDKINFTRYRPPIPTPARSEVAHRLPVRGDWRVNQGGATAELNYHVTDGSPDSKYAVDLGRMVDGKAYRNNGAAAEDYYAYEEPVYATADGEVVAAVDGVADHPPGVDDPTSAAGNLVVLKHGDREYGCYYHLRSGSVRVKVGDTVAAGQLIGQVGNSGNTSGPHLHYHLCNDARPWDATGIPIYFQDVTVIRRGNAQVVADYLPRRGDTVRDDVPPPPPAPEN